MADITVGQITLVYRGETRSFKTVSHAAHFLRQPRLKVEAFHRITAAVDLIGHDPVSQTRYFKGDTYRMMKELVQLEGDLKRWPV